MRVKIYLETTLVSYLTSRPSRDVMRASRQASTQELWDRLDAFEPYVSDLLVGEAEQGDPDAAAQRLRAIESMPILEITDEARQIADALLEASAIPASEPEDALHLGIAAANGMDMVVTWNF